MKCVLNLLQFAYLPHAGVDGAVVYLLQCAHSHLNSKGGIVRIMFSSFFQCL